MKFRAKAPSTHLDSPANWITPPGITARMWCPAILTAMAAASGSLSLSVDILAKDGATVHAFDPPASCEPSDFIGDVGRSKCSLIRLAG